MADENRPSVSSGVKTVETSVYDPELDFFSDKFDPLKALMTPGVKVPVPEAGTYDNVSKYESAVHGVAAHGTKQTKALQARAEGTMSERNFLPHQST